MSDWEINKSEYDILLKNAGYGDFPNADIIVFGNEEGTGGYSTEANVQARINYYGRNEAAGEYVYTIKEKDKMIGFYELSSSNAMRKVEKYLLPGEKIQPKGFTGGVFNTSIARICLALEDVKNRNWFEGSEENPESWELIKKFVVNDLYRTRSGINTALTDWRPLPRLDEGEWPTNYYSIWCPPENQEKKPMRELLKHNDYLKVYNNPKSKRIDNKLNRSINQFSNYYDDIRNRAHLLRILLQSSKAKIIIGIGGANKFKKSALEIMFKDIAFEPFEFKDADMTNLKGSKIKAFTAKIPMEEKTMHVFLIPFPSPGQIFKTQKDAFDMLRELTYKHIKPILSE